MLMFTLAARRRPKDRRTTGASAGVINMDDIAAERREGGGGGRGSTARGERGSESLPRLGSWDGSKLPCHGALNFIAFHSSRTRGDRAWQREGEEGGRGRVSEHYTYLHVQGIIAE